MASRIDRTPSRHFPWRAIGWTFAAVLLAIPFVAMQFTREVDWGPEDFIVMGAMLGGVGLAFEFIVRLSSDRWYRAGAALALLNSFLILWSNLAVGIIGDEDNALNLIFFAIILLALAGAFFARFRAPRMVLVMSMAGVAQAAMAMIGFSQDARGATVSLLFVGLWLLSAAAFRVAASRA